MIRPVLRDVLRPVLRDSFSGLSGIDLGVYNFYVDFPEVKDLVSGQPMTTVLEAGRFNYDGAEFSENVPVIESNGDLLSNGPYSQLVPYSEDTSNWTGSGPWTRSINLGDTGTYTVSTDLNGATVTITAGTATIDAGASATFGNPDQFVVTGIGTITITTDLADPKAQLTLSPYKLPYAINTTAGTLSVTLNYSDADEGNKYPIGDGSVVGTNLLNAFDGVADGVELVTGGDMEDDPITSFALSTATLSVVSDERTGGSGTQSLNGALSSVSAYDIKQSISTTAAGKYELDIWCKNIDLDTSLTVQIWDSVDGVALTTKIDEVALSLSSVWGNTVNRFDALGDYTIIRVRGIGTAIGMSFRADDVSAKQISTAKGEMTILWRPKFDAADVSGVVHILTANDDDTSFIYYNGVTQEIHAFDGTNTSVVACTPVNGTLVNIVLDYGDDSGLKMRLTADATVGAQATFAGSFSNADYMSIAWEEEVPQDIGKILIAKEPSW